MRSKVYKFLFWTHLAGLTVTSPVLVTCVTGALMTYEAQTQAWIDRWGVESHPPMPGPQPLDVETLIQKTHQAAGVAPDLITVFPSRAQPVQVHLSRRRRSSLYLDAYSGAIIGEPSTKTRFLRR